METVKLIKQLAIKASCTSSLSQALGAGFCRSTRGSSCSRPRKCRFSLLDHFLLPAAMDDLIRMKTRQAAASLKRSHSALGVFYRRMRAKLGTPKAIVATAHKLSRIIYQMLKFHSPYHPQTPEQADEHYRQRALRQLQRRAEHFGAKLVLLEPLKGVVS